MRCASCACRTVLYKPVDLQRCMHQEALPCVVRGTLACCQPVALIGRCCVHTASADGVLAAQVLLNGVIGWGLDSAEDLNATFAALHKVMRGTCVPAQLAPRAD